MSRSPDAALLSVNGNGFSSLRLSVTTDVGNLLGLPLLAVGDEKRRTIRQVFLLVIDDESKPPKRFYAMGSAVAVVRFLFALVGAELRLCIPGVRPLT